MKTRMTIFTSLLLAGFAFTSCDDDNDNYTPGEEIVNVLYEKYPNAQRVDWNCNAIITWQTFATIISRKKHGLTPKANG